ncbi:MAG: FG-GAP repeat protein, partial [Bdellovibrionales bacterium]|nr:FG-GAP repeat protein [Bdellovibrionales bacterium]
NLTDALSSEGSYVLCVRARDAAQNVQTLALATTCGWTRDASGPTAPGTFVDGTWFNQTDRTPTLTWVASTDAYTSVASYEIAVGTSPGGTQTLTWTDIGNVLTYQRTGLSLVDGTTYYVSVRGKDILGNIGAVSQGDGFTVDTVGPAAPGTLSDGNFYNSVAQTPIVTWAAAVTGAAPVATYEIAVGTTAGATDVVNWLNIGNVTSYQKSGVTLNNETRYYVSVRAIDVAGNTGSTANSDGWDARTNVVSSFQWVQQAYIKASNAGSGDAFGDNVIISGDTVAVGAYNESSNQTTISNGPTASNDNSAFGSGAVYVFKRSGTTWGQEAYIKAANAQAGDQLSERNIALDGDTLAVGAYREDSNQTTITNGTTASGNNSATDSGAVYVYKRTGTSWAQEAYIKAVNIEAGDTFGVTTAVYGDTLAVGATGEASNQSTITNGATASGNNSLSFSGAVYLYKRNGTSWTQEAYVKPTNVATAMGFGNKVALFGDTLVVGEPNECSNQTTITNGTGASLDTTLTYPGAVFVYKRTGLNWAQEAYIKASNADTNDMLGTSVAIDGDTIVAAAPNESSNQTTITNGATSSGNNTRSQSGAVYIYKRTGVNWAQEAYIKAANANSFDSFGGSVSISGDTVVVGASGEDSNQTTITNGATASSNNSATYAGAAYVYKRTGSTWAQEAFIKAPNAKANDWFGTGVSISGETIAVGTGAESSAQVTITNGPTASNDTSAPGAGAVFIFHRQVVGDMNLDLADERLGIHQEAYIKASNAEADDRFGVAVAISGDTVAVGATYEDSNQTTITNGTTSSANNTVSNSGAVYIYRRNGTNWTQEAYIKAVNAEADDYFGDVALDGDTLVVGAIGEDSNQTTITNGATASSNNGISLSGAAYVYQRTNGSTWTQQAYIKAPNAGVNDMFSRAAIHGNTIIVGAPSEDSGQTTITNGATASADNSQDSSGAAYIFRRTGTSWGQEAYLKAPNPDSGDFYGDHVAIYGDTAVVGATYESSNVTTITNGATASSDNSKSLSGAAYVYKRTGTTWVQEAFLKAANADTFGYFGESVSIYLDTIVVGSIYEWSNQTTITNGTTASTNRSAATSGAAYVYKRTGSNWAQEAYIKASNANIADNFGTAVSIYGDTLIVSSDDEDSNQTTITLGSTASADNALAGSGAVYVFRRTGSSWTQAAYIKASNASIGDNFGGSAQLWGDTAVVGSPWEDSSQTTITNGSTASIDESAVNSGAVYIYRLQSP